MINYLLFIVRLDWDFISRYISRLVIFQIKQLIKNLPISFNFKNVFEIWIWEIEHLLNRCQKDTNNNEILI